ncbi:ABC transporter substrate-binding protein [Bordetella genomosp. 4]|uniref:ABC transporter substrate-binding protein n=1 Tax=Bordetella genomosp. 4 TaxID=463044 RepID=A0A261TUW9_9BORD|nr:ABC transporter substrate-binding protein [Bordetella genomosp. 4]OZI44319.1 ABC transporter substrate-binding protein [Bordetella genomosp. 4]OZI52952.1 ABC transporter substrate-binding protein [Bordetella genomosp. 4]
MRKCNALMLAAALGMYCGLAQAVGPQPAPAKEKQVLTVGFVKVGHLSPIIDVPEAVKACNVEIKPIEFVRYADARTALLSGSVDISGIGPADLAIALAQGSDKLVGLTGVAASPKYLVTRKGVKIEDWKDIAGKRIGIAPGSAVWFQWAATLAEKGVPYNSFTAVNIQGGGTAFVQALKRGDIDAVALWEPFESQLVADGTATFSKNLEYSQSKAVGAELGLLAATRDAVTNKREAVKCFLWAYKSAEEKLAKDPELFAQTYSKYTGLPVEVTRESVKLINLGGVLDLEQLQRQAKTFNELGVIPKDVSGEISKVWDPSLLKEVM